MMKVIYDQRDTEFSNEEPLELLKLWMKNLIITTQFQIVGFTHTNMWSDSSSLRKACGNVFTSMHCHSVGHSWTHKVSDFLPVC
jgi:hypothetical protein